MPKSLGTYRVIYRDSTVYDGEATARFRSLAAARRYYRDQVRYNRFSGSTILERRDSLGRWERLQVTHSLRSGYREE